jgi:deoxycytidylate deaminase
MNDIKNRTMNRQMSVEERFGTCMERAFKVSKLSSEKTKVGAVITNGKDSKCGVNFKSFDGTGTIIHAEEAALSEAADFSNATLYVTIAPCMECALRIIKHGGIVKVVCGPPHPSPVYRCLEAIDTLKNHGIDVDLKIKC